MTLVVDASVAIKLIVEEEGSEAALAVATANPPLLAPDLILTEIANTLATMMRRNDLAVEVAVLRLAAVRRYFGDLTPSEVLAETALRIAATLRHPAYDCFYLALAAQRGVQVITADRRFASRVAGTPWETLVRPLMP